MATEDLKSRFLQQNSKSPGKYFGNFIELGRCLCALQAYAEMPGADKELIKDGLKFLRKYEEDIEMGTSILVGMDLPGTGPARISFEKAKKGVFIGRGDKNPTKVIEYAETLRIILSKASSRQQDIKQVLTDARQRTALLSWSSSIDGDEFSLKELAASTKTGSLTYGRKWIRLAYESLGDLTPAEQTEHLISDINSAVSKATELKQVNAEIISGTGDRQAAENKKEKLLNEISEEARNSSDPSAVMGAVASAVGAPTTHRTETGQQLGLSPEQEDAMLVTGRSIIAAGAGSGKTRVLAGKIVHLLREGAEPSQIMACSFTAKSAGELKERVISYGGARIKENDAGFGTTHSIALKLLATIDPMYKSDKMMINDDALLRRAIEQITVLPSDSKVSVGISPTGPVSFLDEEIAVASTEEDVLLQAVVSNGLSLAKYSRDNYGLKPWIRGDLKLFESILELDEVKVSMLSAGQKAALNKYLETNRGVKNLNKLSKTGLGTGAGYKFASMKRRAEDEEGEENESGITPVNQWFNMGIRPVGGPNEDDYSRFPGSAALEISKFKSEMISASQAWDMHQNGELMVAALIYNAYEWMKNNEGLMDHDDYMIRLVQALTKNPSRLEDIQRQYKYILVDEAQDLNKIQHAMFGLISGHLDPKTLLPKEGMSADTYCLIGDDKQAIYEFRGADPATFIENSDSNGGLFKTKMITSNYRSGKNIIGAANRLMEANTKQIKMTCNYSPSRGDGMIGDVTVEDPQKGADLAISQIKAESEIEGWDDWNEDYPKYGVACRTNKEIADYILACIVHNVPFKAKPGINPFTSKTYRAIFSFLDIRSPSPKAVYRSIFNAYKYLDFGLDAQFAVYLKAQAKKAKTSLPDYFFSKGPVYTSKTHAFRNETFVHPYVDFLSFVKEYPASSAVDFFDAVMNYSVNGVRVKDHILAHQLQENSQGNITTMASSASAGDEASPEELNKNASAPIQVIRDMCENMGDLDKVIDTLISFRDKSKELQVKEEDKAKAVVLDTCHGWKGLEAKSIYIPMGEGIFPSKKAISQKATEEDMESERRLAYVALTRGRDSVTIISSGTAPRSRFIDEACIPPVTTLTKEANHRLASLRRIADDMLADMIIDDDGIDPVGFDY